MKLLKQVTYITYVLAKPSNLSKSTHRPSHISFYRGFFENKKARGTDFQATPFIEFLDKKFWFIMLRT